MQRSRRLSKDRSYSSKTLPASLRSGVSGLRRRLLNSLAFYAEMKDDVRLTLL